MRALLLAGFLLSGCTTARQQLAMDYKTRLDACMVSDDEAANKKCVSRVVAYHNALNAQMDAAEERDYQQGLQFQQSLQNSMARQQREYERQQCTSREGYSYASGVTWYWDGNACVPSQQFPKVIVLQ